MSGERTLQDLRQDMEDLLQLISRPNPVRKDKDDLSLLISTLEKGQETQLRELRYTLSTQKEAELARKYEVSVLALLQSRTK